MMNSLYQSNRHYSGWLILLLYFLSGAIALSYEVLWARMVSLQFGVSNYGVVITIAAFMLGLGLGSLFAHKIMGRIRSPLLLFALVEITISIYAVSMPMLLQLISDWQYQAAAEMGVAAWHFMQTIVLLIVLLVPALLMGLAFPFVVRIAENHQITLGTVYGVNTLGGACGAVLPLIILPLYGWYLSIQIVALLGLLVGLSLFVMSLKHGRSRGYEHTVSTAVPVKSLLAYALIGAAAIAIQVVWTRLFGMLMLRTEYVLGIILLSFLLGMGLGSLLARSMKGNLWLWLVPVCASLFTVLSIWWLPIIADWVETSRNPSLFSAMFEQGLLVTMVTLPVTIALGSWLPLITRAYQGQASAAASLYGANSIGAAVGAIVAGFVLIPVVGSVKTLIIAMLVLLLAGSMWMRHKRYALLFIPITLIALPVSDLPAVAMLQPNAQALSNDLYLFEDAVSVTHVIEQQDGQRILLSDLQRMDASTELAAVEVQKNQGRLPLMLHHDPQRVLFLGLGTGITAAGTLAYPSLHRDAVEISKGAIEAATKWFLEVNGGVIEHLQVIHDDARRYLMRTNQNYDVIIGDLFHPDLVGRSALLSVQQFTRVKAHLQDDGLFVQWLALNQFDQKSLDVVLRSFAQVYPDAVIFVEGFRLALVGPKGEWLGAPAVESNLNRMSQSDRDSLLGGEGVDTWLGRYWGRIKQSDGPVQDELRPYIEFSLPHARYGGGVDLALLLEGLLALRPDVDVAARELGVDESRLKGFSRGFIATELAMRSWYATLQGDDKEGSRLMNYAYQANPKDRWAGYALADAMILALPELRQQGVDEKTVLAAVLKIRPEHVTALQAMAALSKKQGDYEQAEKIIQRVHTLSPLLRLPK